MKSLSTATTANPRVHRNLPKKSVQAEMPDLGVQENNAENKDYLGRCHLSRKVGFTGRNTYVGNARSLKHT